MGATKTIRIETIDPDTGGWNVETFSEKAGKTNGVIRAYIAENNGTLFRGNVYLDGQPVLLSEPDLQPLCAPSKPGVIPTNTRDYLLRTGGLLPVNVEQVELEPCEVEEATTEELKTYQTSARAAHSIVSDAYKRAVVVQEQALARAVEVHERILARIAEDAKTEREELAAHRRALRQEHTKTVELAIHQTRTVQAQISVINARSVEDRVAIPQIMAQAYGPLPQSASPPPQSEQPQGPFWTAVDNMLRLINNMGQK